MTKLPNKEFRQLVVVMRKKEFYESEQKRAINWTTYNKIQTEDAIVRMKFIRTEVDNSEQILLKGKCGRPLTNPKSLAKAVLASEAFGYTERSSQGWMQLLSPYLGIKECLDDRTIGDAYDKPEVLFILNQIFTKTKTSNGILSGDGTGLETSRKENYESTKKTGDYLTSIVDSREIVQAFDATGIHESKAMHKLIELVYGDSLRLDAGFNDRKLVKRIAQRGIIPFVFPKKSNNLNGSLAWKNMYLELFMDVMQWLTQYHIRSHSESFHSSFKSRFGIITKHRGAAKISQITARIIIHNSRRLDYFNSLN
jgi:transposase